MPLLMEQGILTGLFCMISQYSDRGHVFEHFLMNYCPNSKNIWHIYAMIVCHSVYFVQIQMQIKYSKTFSIVKKTN